MLNFFLQDLRIILALMLREMATSYGKSIGGYIWAVLEPAAGIALLSLIFAIILPEPPLGTNFALFYAGGYVLFMMYMNISSKLTAALRYSKPLLTYPVVRLGHVMVARLILNMGVELIVLTTVLAGIVQLWGLQVGVDLGHMAVAVLMTALLASGVGVLNCWITAIFPDWERVWAIFNRPLFIISTLLFTYESVPEPFQSWLWYNPLVHIIGHMRMGMYPGYEGAFVSLIYVLAVSLLAFVVGYFWLCLKYRDYALS